METPEKTIRDTLALREDQHIVVSAEGLTVPTGKVLSATDIRLFPNPVRDVVHILTDWSGQYSLHIVDAMGRIIYRHDDQMGAMDVPIRFEPGLYQVILTTGDQRITKPFVVY